MTGILLAAGNGERLKKSLHKDCVKPLLEVEGFSLIARALQATAELGAVRIVVVVGQNAVDLRQAVRSLVPSAEFAYQPRALGLLNAVSTVFDTVDDDVFIVLSDEIFIKPYFKGLSDLCRDETTDFIVTYVKTENKEEIQKNFSIELDSASNVKQCVEKPAAVVNDMKGTGIYYLNRECFALLKQMYSREKNEPNELCEFFNFLIQNGKTGKAFCIAEQEINVNTAEDLTRAETLLV